MSEFDLIAAPIGGRFVHGATTELTWKLSAALEASERERRRLESETIAARRLVLAIIEKQGPIEIPDSVVVAMRTDATIRTEHNSAKHSTRIWATRTEEDT